MASLLDTARALRRRAESALRTRVRAASAALKAYGEAREPAVSSALPSQVPVLDVWDVEDVRAALLAHEYGDFSRSALLADHMRRNDRIAAVLNTRLLAVASLPQRLDPSPDAPDAARAKAIADDLAARVRAALPRHDAARIVEDVAFCGISICHRVPVYDPVMGQWSITLRPWHLSWVRWDNTQGAYRVHTQGGTEYCPPDGSNPRWCVFRALGGDRPWMAAAVRSLAIPFLIAGWADRDWARWSEKHGLPPLGAKVPYANRYDAATGDFLDALQSLATEPTILLAQNADGKPSFDLEWKELKNWQSYQGFKDLSERQDARFAITLLGQNLTTQVTGGSFAAAKAHELVRQDYLTADATMLTDGVRAAVAVPLTRIEYEPDATLAHTLAPLPVWDASAPKDDKVAAETRTAQADAVKAWQDVGVTIDASAAAKDAGMLVSADAPAAQSPIFAYHIELGVVTKDEARARLGFGPLPNGEGAKPVAVAQAAEAQADATAAETEDAAPPADTKALPVRYSRIDFMPPKSVRDACKRGLKLHAQGLSGDGLVPATMTWARRLADGGTITPDKVRRMNAWHARHAADYRPGWDSPPTPGYVANLLWGGTPGKHWAAQLVEEMDRADHDKDR